MKNNLVRLLFLALVIPLIIGADKEGGIIGTGVVGQITGLNQFEVSGMQFEIEENVPLVGLNSLQDLDMGMTLAVRAKREGNDWYATHIRRISVLVGPITSGSEVMGIPVIGDLPNAERVRVDGFWSESGIVATRIEAVKDGGDTVTGPTSLVDRIVELVTAEGKRYAVQDDRIVTFSGLYKDGQFIVNSSETGLFAGVEPNLLMAEGYFSKPDKDGEINFLVTDARSEAQEVETHNQQKRSVRCSYNGRTDFVLDEIQMPERETAIALCSNLPR